MRHTRPVGVDGSSTGLDSHRKRYNYKEKDVVQDMEDWVEEFKWAIIQNMKSCSEEFSLTKKQKRISENKLGAEEENTFSMIVESVLDMMIYVHCIFLDLQESSRLQIISITGEQKEHNTFLARRFFDCFKFGFTQIWITASPKSRPRDILLGLLQSVLGDSFSDENYKESDKSLCALLHRMLCSRTFVVVMDDLPNTETWGFLSSCFPYDSINSVIILTSRLTDAVFHLFPHCCGSTENVHFKMNEDESWERLSFEVFPRRSCPIVLFHDSVVFIHEGCTPELVHIGKMIAKKCQGLLSAIYKVGRLLSKSKTLDHWQDVFERFGSIIRVFLSDRMVCFVHCVPKSSKDANSSRTKQNKQEIDYVLGHETDRIRILDRLTGDKCNLEVVTIVGMGGIGKTTMAKRVFDDPLVQHRFDIRAWITVSQTYTVRDLLLGLLQSLVHLDGDVSRKNDYQLAEELYRRLKGQRFLIVMDDMWSTKAWDEMKRSFPDDKNGSRILVTSRWKDLADYVNPFKPPHHMSFLSKDESWQLLHHRIFQNQSCSSELEQAGRRIADKCQGLPLAVLVIAGILSNISMEKESWENVAQSMSSVLIGNPEQCLEILAMSYNYLPHHLKACFLYMCAFPEDCEIDVTRLIKLWVAEEFVLPEVEQLKSLEEMAAEYLEELISRSLVLVGKRRGNGILKTCRIHDLLRDLSLREAQRENFMHVITGQASPESIGNMQRLSYHSGSCSNLHSESFIPSVLSFLCFTVGCGGIQDIRFFLFNFKLLRVLDVGFLRFDYFPIPILKLVDLRFLSLTAACEVPSSISELLNLQTLIIYGPWIRKNYGKCPTLPPEIWKMSQLRHFNLTAACYLPEPLESEDDVNNTLVLKNLQTLSTIRAASCTKEVLERTPDVKKLAICEVKEDYEIFEGSFDFLKNLARLHQLEALKASFYGQMRKTKIQNGRPMFPPGLKKLILSWSYLPWEDMDKLGMLPNLEELKLKNHAFQGSTWESGDVQFAKLKLLLLDNVDLVHWEADSYNFPCLQHLILKHCELLEAIPGDIADDLQLIELHHCSSSAEISAKEIQEVQKSRDNDGLDILILN